MAHNYISEEERHRLEENKKRKDELDRIIAKSNASLVGNPKEYKGVMYQMRQNGLYECLNVEQGSKLTGLFTSPRAIMLVVDEMERQGKPSI